MSADPLVAVRGLSAGYGGTPVVHDLDLHVDPGELVALLGANGAGKTTTLRAVVGLLSALAGEVQVLGAPVRPGRTHHVVRRGLGYVPEGTTLASQLTTAENLRLAMRAASDVEDALDRFPALRPLLGRRAGLLSGGEQRMLGIARALAGRPRVLLVDELSLGLSPALVQRLLPELRAIASETGIGILLVEQHVPMALAVADRAYVLHLGRIVATGAASEMAERCDLLRASYLGEAAISDNGEEPDKAVSARSARPSRR